MEALLLNYAKAVFLSSFLFFIVYALLKEDTTLSSFSAYIDLLGAVTILTFLTTCVSYIVGFPGLFIGYYASANMIDNGVDAVVPWMFNAAIIGIISVAFWGWQELLIIACIASPLVGYLMSRYAQRAIREQVLEEQELGV